jgi:type I restriction enzyme S subunit
MSPNSELLEQYSSIVSSGVSKIEVIKEENRKLCELRDWLLPMLMNGQVTVKA